MPLLNNSWFFAKNTSENFNPVALPHDWLIADVNHLYQSGIGYYKRDLDTTTLLPDQRHYIRFDGVYMDSTLYVNDQMIGSWKYGYTAFEFDITDALSGTGYDTLLLKVVYEAPNSRWYTGAGLYRDVYHIVKNPCHFANDGIYIHTDYVAGVWTYTVDVDVIADDPYEVIHEIIDLEGDIVPWSLEQPQCYTLRSQLFVNGAMTDTVDTRFGFRTLNYTSNQGFFLNGKYVKMNGVCLHHDLGGLGASVHKDAIIRQLKLLKAMGVNAIRTAHNPPAKVFMELTDEMGFLVMSELLDMWKRPKNTYDYARFYEDWIEKDVASWVRRDRNHPSLILWSVGNEIYDTHADAVDGGNTLKQLMDLVKVHDPKGNAPITLCSNYMPWENTQKCADIVKLIGYNYAEYLYQDHHNAHPEWIIYGAETCSTVQSRGVYHFPLSQSILSDDDMQCSALGNSSTSWGARSVEACIIADRDTPFSFGQFLWAGQDYLGEPTPYHTKNTYLGHIDTAGFEKDTYYIFKAAWTDHKVDPMIHLFPYWDFSPGQPIDIRVCSNAPTVELIFNDVSQGRQITKDVYTANWILPYSVGTLTAKAYDEHDNCIAIATQKSFNDVHQIDVKAVHYDALSFFTITANDIDGHPVENANCRVQVTVSSGSLLALDNGDATDYDQYQTDSRRLFNGKLLAIVDKTANELPNIDVKLVAWDIPIRKIELVASGDQITAKTYPENATYQDINWRLTDAAGIDSPLGYLEVSQDKKIASLVKKGDGTVYVRCTTNNGLDHPNLIAQLPITISGMGKAFLNPYEFVSGGLYTDSNVALTNGNERGVATLRDGESHVLFEDLDFGDYGSDTLTLPLFPLEKAPFDFEIYEGRMTDSAMPLMTCHYDKGSIWNTYQAVTYTLPKRLKGIVTLTLVFRQKVHIKGFSFERKIKAFEKLYAAHCNQVYGDSYTLVDSTIEGIGNNVSLIFDHMDFGSNGAHTLTLNWRSQTDKNSMQVLISDGQTTTKQMIELTEAKTYNTGTFPLEKRLTGPQTITLVFLPGTNMDLNWIQFQ